MDKQPTIIIDTREQAPLVFPADVPAEPGTLTWGDYSLKHLTDLVAIERKALPDLVACCGRERERFERELLALRGMKYKAVLVEANLRDIEAGKWRGEVTPAMVLGSVASWRVKMGLEFVYCGTPELAAAECWRLLRKFHDWCKDYARRFQ